MTDVYFSQFWKPAVWDQDTRMTMLWCDTNLSSYDDVGQKSGTDIVGVNLKCWQGYVPFFEACLGYWQNSVP